MFNVHIYMDICFSSRKHWILMTCHWLDIFQRELFLMTITAYGIQVCIICCFPVVVVNLYVQVCQKQFIPWSHSRERSFWKSTTVLIKSNSKALFMQRHLNFHTLFISFVRFLKLYLLKVNMERTNDLWFEYFHRKLVLYMNALYTMFDKNFVKKKEQPRL